jgi:hypothetical protein
MENEEVDLSGDKYIKFVTESINTYKQYTDRLIKSESILQPYDVQYILAHYQTVKSGLLSEMCRRKRLYKIADRNFKLWWNSCLLAAKNSLTGDGKKYVAVKDYTIQAEENNKEEYIKRQEEVQDAEEMYEFIKSLKSDWDSFQFILQMLNDNMKSELRSLTLDGRETYEPKRCRTIKN